MPLRIQSLRCLERASLLLSIGPVFPERFRPSRFITDISGVMVGAVKPGLEMGFSLVGVIESDMKPGFCYLTLTPCTACSSERASHPSGLLRRSMFAEGI